MQEEDDGYAKVVVTLTAVLMAVAMTSAQTPRQSISTDTAAVQSLTTEIGALRADLAESARTSLRLQLLTARIQAQELGRCQAPAGRSGSTASASAGGRE